MSLPLNINVQQILLHLFNFVILFGVLYFLLYKPVKQFMDQRTEYYKKLDEEANANLEVSRKAMEEYQKKIEAAEAEIAEKKELARRETNEANAALLRQAEEEAAKRVAQARQTIEHDRAKMLRQAQDEISDLVSRAAEKLVMGSSTSDAYDQFLAAAERGDGDA